MNTEHEYSIYTFLNMNDTEHGHLKMSYAPFIHLGHESGIFEIEIVLNSIDNFFVDRNRRRTVIVMQINRWIVRRCALCYFVWIDCLGVYEKLKCVNVCRIGKNVQKFKEDTQKDGYIENIRHELFVVIFRGRNESLFKFCFFSCAYQNVNW